MHRSAAAILIIIILVNLFATAFEARSQSGERQLYELSPNRVDGSVDRVEALMEAEGALKIDGSEKARSSTVQMAARASLAYFEKPLGNFKTPGRFLSAIRHYEKADASIQVGDQQFRPSLRDQRRLIGVELRELKPVLYSPHGPLTREELDLIDVQGNTLLLERLLPSEQVAVGDSWKHSHDVLAALLGLDAVASSDAQSVLQSVEQGAAKLEMAGQVEGSIHGRPTRLQVRAKYRFDLELGRITWFALLLKEDREVSPIGPGLDVVARLQIKIEPNAAAKQLEEPALKNVFLGATAELEQLSYTSPDRTWRALLDRRWVLISDSKDLTVFRMVDEGKYIAQCNVSTLAAQPKEVTLSHFQDEIRRALGKDFRRFVRAGQAMTDGEQRVFRVEVQGESSGIPMDWIYYRIVDKSNQGIVVLFALESSLADRFRESDRDLVRTLRFAEPKSAKRHVAD